VIKTSTNTPTYRRIFIISMFVNFIAKIRKPQATQKSEEQNLARAMQASMTAWQGWKMASSSKNLAF